MVSRFRVNKYAILRKLRLVISEFADPKNSTSKSLPFGVMTIDFSRSHTSPLLTVKWVK